MKGTLCKPEKLHTMVEEREEAMLDQVLNKKAIKQKVLVQDRVYTWTIKKQEEIDVRSSF
jgi:hypothetical protein